MKSYKSCVLTQLKSLKVFSSLCHKTISTKCSPLYPLLMKGFMSHPAPSRVSKITEKAIRINILQINYFNNSVQQLAMAETLVLDESDVDTFIVIERHRFRVASIEKSTRSHLIRMLAINLM